MPHIKAREKSIKSEKLLAWDEAIQEAENQIRELRKAVKTFTKHRDAGEEWPGFKTTGTAVESVPAKG